MVNKEIVYIYSRNKLDFKKYIKIKKHADVINYNDIISKLTKNDINNDKPSDIVINSHLRKKIIKALNSDNTTILYALKTLTIDTILSINILMQEINDSDFNINLVILNEDKIKIEIDEEFLSYFKTINYINI